MRTRCEGRYTALVHINSAVHIVAELARESLAAEGADGPCRGVWGQSHRVRLAGRALGCRQTA